MCSKSPSESDYYNSSSYYSKEILVIGEVHSRASTNYSTNINSHCCISNDCHMSTILLIKDQKPFLLPLGILS